MSRWLLLPSCILVLASVASIEPRRSPAARDLAGECTRDSDCQTGLSCSGGTDVMAGQCTANCSSSVACEDNFGLASVCLGADVCARTCAVDSQCPSGSACNVYGWCDGTLR